jgi:hypothetical protein
LSAVFFHRCDGERRVVTLWLLFRKCGYKERQR